MLIGNLGTHEVLLLGCDDGDVLAYYTHSISFAVLSKHQSTQALIKPFFHENVGLSVWGLALHEKSRLLAASSNLKEVTVFVFACSNHDDVQLKTDFLPFEEFTDTSKLWGSLSHAQKLSQFARYLHSMAQTDDTIPTEEQLKRILPDNATDKQKEDFFTANTMDSLHLSLDEVLFMSRTCSSRRTLALGENGSNSTYAFSSSGRLRYWVILKTC
jgi:hypothetical protein